jgi:hypothetical protein
MLTAPITGDQELDSFLYNIGETLSSYTGVTTTGGGSSSSYTNPNAGTATGYPYRYMHIKYADDNVGTGFANTPSGKKFFGIYNSDLSTESTNPTDYTWIEASNGGFGTGYGLWYVVTAGRQFNYYISITTPGTLYSVDGGVAIDLNLISTIATQSARVAYSLVFDYLSASPSFYTSTGSLSVPPINTWSGGETWSSVVPYLSPGSTMYQIDGIFDTSTGLTTWGPPYLAKLKVGSLTANNIIVGDAPNISGTTMTGSGALIKTNGTFALGDVNRNVVNNGSVLSINGFLTPTTFSTYAAVSGTTTFPVTTVISTQSTVTPVTMNSSKFLINAHGVLNAYWNGTVERMIAGTVEVIAYDNTKGSYIYVTGFYTVPAPLASYVNYFVTPNQASNVKMPYSFSTLGYSFAGTLSYSDGTPVIWAGHSISFSIRITTKCTLVNSLGTGIAELYGAPDANGYISIMDFAI